MADLLAAALAVRQEIFLDVVTIRLEQDVGAAQLADLLLGPLDHAVALAGLLIKHLPAAGDLEALFGARLGLELGHLALLFGGKGNLSAPSAVHLLVMSVLIEHFTAATAAHVRRAAGGRGYDRCA